jgi:DNA-binding beta-propeller fold protein YncE
MERNMKLARLAVAAALCVGWAGAGSAAPVAGDYVYAGDIDLGAPGQWDYASFDAAGGRLYVGHADRIDVVDVAARKLVGSVGPLDEAHGAAIAPALNRGFATSGGDGLLKEFDLSDLHVVKAIPIGPDVDGVIFDPGTNTVLVALGDSKQLAIVDAASASVTHKIDLPGAPEFLAADGHGKAFANLASTTQLARIDIASGRVEAVWPLPGCKSPHGLAYDHRTHRLFSGCANKVLVVVNPENGAVLATLPTGSHSDAVVVDEARRRVFCPNGDGTLTEIAEGAADAYSVIRTLPTFLGARSMAIDPRTGALFITYGNIQIKLGPQGMRSLQFVWDAAKSAVFTPND